MKTDCSENSRSEEERKNPSQIQNNAQHLDREHIPPSRRPKIQMAADESNGPSQLEEAPDLSVERRLKKNSFALGIDQKETASRDQRDTQ